MQIEITDRLPPEVDELAQRSPEATFYHSSTWIESLADTFGSFRIRSVVACEGERLLGYLPYVEIKRFVGRQAWSLPFGTYGGPVTGGNDQIAAGLVERYVALRNEPGMLEVGLIDFAGLVTTTELRFEDASTHVVRLPKDFEALRARFEKSKRRQARKAEREGVIVRSTRAMKDIRSYYEVYAERCRSWRQSLVYPREFFERLVERGNEGVRLFVAEDSGGLIGGHLNLYFRDTVIAWNGVTVESDRASQAGTLLYTTCLRDACERGFRFYNLGASLGKGTLESYKRALGGELVMYKIGRRRSLQGRLAAAIKRLSKR